MKVLKIVKTGKSKNEKGFTLLEYCAGAAVVAAVVYGALNAFGNKVDDFLNNGVGKFLQNMRDDTKGEGTAK